MAVKPIGKSEGLVWIALGITICVISWDAQLGSFAEPGPGFIGFIAGCFVAVIGIIMMALKFVPAFSRTTADAGTGTPLRIQSWRTLAYTMILLVLYSILLDPLGYIVATFLLMYGLFYNKEKGWLRPCIPSIITVAVTYLVFEVWLRCQLPRGIFP